MIPVKKSQVIWQIHILYLSDVFIQFILNVIFATLFLLKKRIMNLSSIRVWAPLSAIMALFISLYFWSRYWILSLPQFICTWLNAVLGTYFFNIENWLTKHVSNFSQIKLGFVKFDVIFLLFKMWLNGSFNNKCTFEFF